MLAAALLTAGAAAVHFGVAPEHLAEYPPHGVFFILTAAAQLALAMAILAAPSGRLFVVATLGTVGVIGVYLLSRTVGLPFGPSAPEPVGLADFLTTLAEAISVVLFLRLIRAPLQPRARGPVRVTLATAPALLLAMLLILLAVGSASNPMPMTFNAAPALPGQSTTSVTALVARTGGEPVHSLTLAAAPLQVDGHAAFAYNGSVPGPELRVTQGERVRVTLVNHLREATSIHWHGINVPNSADGVSGITQNAVAPGATFTYEFLAGESGTYWYHSHQATEAQVTRGLYGAIVVLPRGGSTERRDYSVLFHSAIAGDDVRVNGGTGLHLDAAPGETVRLRLTNAAIPFFDGAPITPVLVGAPYRVVALDGHDLNAPPELGPQRIRLGMGQRADLVFAMPAGGAVALTGVKGVHGFPWSPPANTVAVTIGQGASPAPVASAPFFDLTGYGLPASDPVAAATFDVTRTLVLSGVPGFRNGGFAFLDSFSGMASPLVPPIRVHEGQFVKLHLVNQSQKFHPIHIHGHTFTVLSRNGQALTGSPIHVDAVLVPPGETWDVGFKADNPGIWMLHCHVLGHAGAGMSMTVNYEGISTPFTMGFRSGNVPE